MIQCILCGKWFKSNKELGEHLIKTNGKCGTFYKLQEAKIKCPR